MRAFSRDVFVGFLLVMAVVASGCQPVQPIVENDASATRAVIVESEAVTDTAVLSETLTASSAVVTAQPTESADVAVTAEATITAETLISGTIVAETAVTGTATGVVPSQGEANEVDPTLLAEGVLVYRAQYCGVCHTLDAAETRGVFGPPHNDMRATAEIYLSSGQYQGAAATPAEYIRESIVDPQAFISPGFATTSHRMPSYAHLDRASIDALVALLLAQ